MREIMTFHYVIGHPKVNPWQSLAELGAGAWCWYWAHPPFSRPPGPTGEADAVQSVLEAARDPSSGAGNSGEFLLDKETVGGPLPPPLFHRSPTAPRVLCEGAACRGDTVPSREDIKRIGIESQTRCSGCGSGYIAGEEGARGESGRAGRGASWLGVSGLRGPRPPCGAAPQAGG